MGAQGDLRLLTVGIHGPSCSDSLAPCASPKPESFIFMPGFRNHWREPLLLVCLHVCVGVKGVSRSGHPLCHGAAYLMIVVEAEESL